MFKRKAAPTATTAESDASPTDTPLLASLGEEVAYAVDGYGDGENLWEYIY